MANLPLMQHKCHPKYASRTWQKVYFASSRELSHEQREALATEAYERELEAARHALNQNAVQQLNARSRAARSYRS